MAKKLNQQPPISLLSDPPSTTPHSLETPQSFRFDIDLSNANDTVYIGFADLVKETCGGALPSYFQPKGYSGESEDEDDGGNHQGLLGKHKKHIKNHPSDSEMQSPSSPPNHLVHPNANMDLSNENEPGGDFFDKLLKKYGTEEEVQVFESKKRKWVEDYDINDPFIDDSEMFLDDVGLVKPKQSGFFAYSGDLEVIPVDESEQEQQQKETNTPTKKNKTKNNSVKKWYTLGT